MFPAGPGDGRTGEPTTQSTSQELSFGSESEKRPRKPYEFVGLGPMDVTKPYKLIVFDDIHGPQTL